MQKKSGTLEIVNVNIYKANRPAQVLVNEDSDAEVTCYNNKSEFNSVGVQDGHKPSPSQVHSTPSVLFNMTVLSNT